MNRDEFDKLRDRHYAEITGINHAKGKDYAGDKDALANFKVIGKDLGLDPLKVWGVYASKHWSAVMAYVREGKVESEPIEGRLHDVILYCFLLLGLIEEGKLPNINLQEFARAQQRGPTMPRRTLKPLGEGR